MPITVNRNLFMHWLDGVLLDFKDGKGIVCDYAEFELVEPALDNGETVYMADSQGCIVSYVKKVDDAYREFAWSPGHERKEA